MPLFRKDLQNIQGYLRPASEGDGAPLVRLHMNEAAADWPAEARAKLLERLQAAPFRLYPERQRELSERLRRRLGAPEDGILLGPSSGALLDLVALAGLEPGDRVAVPQPGFSLYPLLAQRHQVKIQEVPVGLGFPIEAWRKALESGVRQLWITVPNNPTGAWVTPEELLPLLEQAAALADPPLVVIDEAYSEFAPRTHRLAVDAFENVLLLRTFSKALASAGWRLGYLIGNPAVIRKLAGLQLPYSIPLPALEALDVAMDFAAEFDAEIRRTAERRDRLAECLGVPSGAENFLLVSPDPAPRLKAAGLLCRTFTGEDRARLSIGSEEETAAAARALGRELPPAKSLSRRRLLVLDVDGVLIEADRSFMDAVARALEELLPGLEWSDDHFQAFKRAGGFNNDFRLTAGAVALAERGEMARLWSSEGKGLSDLGPRLNELEPQCKEVVQRHYADTRWQERPLATLAELKETGMDLAVLTGRPPEEWAMAIETLGFELPAISDSAEHLRKPRPEGLLQLADAFRAQEIVFVGDTRDDAACLAAAREIRPEIRWTFAAVGPDRARISCERDLVVPTLRDLLPLLKEERP